MPAGGGRLHALIAIGAALLTALIPRNLRTPARFAVVASLLAGASALVLRTPLKDDGVAALPLLLSAIAIGLAMWLCIDLATRSSNGPRVALGLWGAASGSSAVLLQSGNLALAQLSGALAASLGVFVLALWWRPQAPMLLGATPVFVAVFLTLLIAGRGFASSWKPTDWSFVLAAAAAASPIAFALPFLRSQRPWVLGLLTVLLSLGLCAAGIAMSAHGFDFGGY
jgi:hypothetical protein